MPIGTGGRESAHEQQRKKLTGIFHIASPDGGRNGQPHPRFGLERDQWGQLVFIGADGKKHANVAPVALFPISQPETWISIRTADGTELACIEDPRTLPADVWQLLKEDLSRREFVPMIRRIVRVSGNTEPCEWQVETDRGPTRFVLKSEDDVRRIGEHEILILDAHGTRYHIPDLTRRRCEEPPYRGVVCVSRLSIPGNFAHRPRNVPWMLRKRTVDGFATIDAGHDHPLRPATFPRPG